MKPLIDRFIVVKGAGEMATGVACRLFRANFRRILMLERLAPLAVRRQVSFCEAVHDRYMTVEGITAIRVDTEAELQTTWSAGRIAVAVDPLGESIGRYRPDVLVDATIAKRNLGIAISDAPLVIALGPGFTAGVDCHLVIETNRGHDLGRAIALGTAAPNTSIPGDIGGYTAERVLRAPADGTFQTQKKIGDTVLKGEVFGLVDSVKVNAAIDGIVRGLIRPGSDVTKGLKIGDIDPRGQIRYCDTISEKARALGGAVLEAMLASYNKYR